MTAIVFVTMMTKIMMLITTMMAMWFNTLRYYSCFLWSLF